MISVGLFGPLCGLAAAIAGHSLDALPGSFLASFGVLTLIAAAVGMATAMLLRVFGLLGITLGSMLLLTLGNASSAAVSRRPCCPRGWSPSPSSCRPAPEFARLRGRPTSMAAALSRDWSSW